MDHFSNAKVQVKQGWLQGYTEGELKIFKGIPYAAPPVGELRFSNDGPPKDHPIFLLLHVRPPPLFQ